MTKHYILVVNFTHPTPEVYRSSKYFNHLTEEKSRVTIFDNCRGQQSNSSIPKESDVFFLGSFRFVFIF